MQPTRTSVGLETPSQTVSRARSLMSPQTGLATSQTPSRIRVEVPEVIPSDALRGDNTLGDVFARRNEMEQEVATRNQANSDFDSLMSRIQSPTPTGSLFTNPSEAINRLLLGRPTDTQTRLDQTFGRQAEATQDFAQDYADTATDARSQFGIPELQTNLAETRTRIAERTNNLRQTLRDFEVNAERRGGGIISREAVNSEKQAIESKAYQELADLAIIESAQLGNLTEARTEVTNLLADKEKAYNFEYAGIQAEINRLTQLNTQDAEQRAGQLTVALAEKQAQDAKQLEFETNKYNALVEAAPYADTATLDAIRNAKNPFELATMAGPFIGRLERMQAQASIANIYDQINSRQVALREATLSAVTEQEKVQKENEAKADQVLEIKSLAESLVGDSGLSSAVGFGIKKNVFSRVAAGAGIGAGVGAAAGAPFAGVGAVPGAVGGAVLGGIGGFFAGPEAVQGSARADFEAKAERLANSLTLDNLKLMSGPLTDNDIRILATAGSTLTNLNQSDPGYIEELQRVIKEVDRVIGKTGITPEQALYWGITDEQELQTIDSVWDSL